ncbi:hypothetical protein AAFF_G00435000 [Aldrovandia affinis]|uniref:Uncharacterized protein n=1 Tax=Aldrovandia affinis TaxID=143900 RepID=A0AAD7WI17_9TELE|nr:hypothetical protein AAFF_G00435000 [Aldrovandia affinis]
MRATQDSRTAEVTQLTRPSRSSEERSAFYVSLAVKIHQRAKRSLQRGQSETHQRCGKGRFTAADDAMIMWAELDISLEVISSVKKKVRTQEKRGRARTTRERE